MKRIVVSHTENFEAKARALDLVENVYIPYIWNHPTVPEHLELTCKDKNVKKVATQLGLKTYAVSHIPKEQLNRLKSN